MNNSYTASQLDTLATVPAELISLCKLRHKRPYIASQKAYKGLTGEVVVTYSIIDRNTVQTSYRAYQAMKWVVTIGKRGAVRIVEAPPYSFRKYID